MKNVLTIVALVMLWGFMAGNSQAVVLHFDDIITAGRSSVQSGYGGLDWDSFVVFSGGNLPYQYDAGIVSGNYAVYNASSNIASVSAERFSFVGASLSSAGVRGDSPLPITIRGYRGNDNIFSQTINAGVGAAWYEFNFTDIDRLTFGSPSQLVMDDFTYSTTPVPEPATVLLLAMGLGSVGVFSLRRGKR